MPSLGGSEMCIKNSQPGQQCETPFKKKKKKKKQKKKKKKKKVTSKSLTVPEKQKKKTYTKLRQLIYNNDDKHNLSYHSLSPILLSSHVY